MDPAALAEERMADLKVSFGFEEEELMKTSEEVLNRIFINLALAERSTCQGGWPSYPRRNRRAWLKNLKNWLEKENRILQAMNEDEKKMIYKHMGTNTTIKELYWYWEAEEVLCWAVNIVDQIEIPYYKKNIRQLYSAIDAFTGYEPITTGPSEMIYKFSKIDAMDALLSQIHMRPQEEIEAERDRAMIWHWRAIERKADIFKKEPFKEIIERTFQDPEITKAVDSMPVAPDGKDLLVGKKKKFYALSEEHMVHAMIYAGWRQKALEWVLNDESWEDTTADT